jgi:hypothetical protein
VLGLAGWEIAVVVPIIFVFVRAGREVRREDVEQLVAIVLFGVITTWICVATRPSPASWESRAIAPTRSLPVVCFEEQTSLLYSGTHCFCGLPRSRRGSQFHQRGFARLESTFCGRDDKAMIDLTAECCKPKITIVMIQWHSTDAHSVVAFPSRHDDVRLKIRSLK